MSKLSLKKEQISLENRLIKKYLDNGGSVTKIDNGNEKYPKPTSIEELQNQREMLHKEFIHTRKDYVILPTNNSSVILEGATIWYTKK